MNDSVAKNSSAAILRAAAVVCALGAVGSVTTGSSIAETTVRKITTTTTTQTQAIVPAKVVVEGAPFRWPDYKETPAQREARRRATVKAFRQADRTSSLTRGVAKKTPPAKRGTQVDVDAQKLRGSSPYYGIGQIVQYENWEAADSSNTCGHAALATLLTRYGRMTPVTGSGSTDYNAPVRTLERAYPATWINLGFRKISIGMNPTAMEKALTNYRMNYSWWSGENEMRNWVAKGYPVIAMLDMGKLGGDWYTIHYVVVFGYDANYYYVTNMPGNKIPRQKFLNAWGSDLLRQIGWAAGGEKNNKVLLSWPK